MLELLIVEAMMRGRKAEAERLIAKLTANERMKFSEILIDLDDLIPDVPYEGESK